MKQWEGNFSQRSPTNLTSLCQFIYTQVSGYQYHSEKKKWNPRQVNIFCDYVGTTLAEETVLLFMPP